jgi:hypothetical protein
MRQANKGEATSFGLFDSFYSFNPKTGTWFGETIEQKNGLTTTQLITNLGLTKSEFTSLKGKLPPLTTVKTEEEEEEEIKTTKEVVENSEDFAFNAQPSKILKIWKSRYDGMGFEFAVSGTMGSTITITAKNGAKLKTRLGSVKGNRNDQAKELNDFIEKNKI